MKIVYFTHSLRSCWNHGNAHFLRGVVTELISRGHEVRVLEPADAWSVQNLVADHGEAAAADFERIYPDLKPEIYDAEADLDDLIAGADVVIVHEWNDHQLVAAIGRHRRGKSYRLLFHDTHHRAVSQPEAMAAYDLSGFDGVLAFGAVIRDLYLEKGWAKKAWTWHEAADVRVFKALPPPQEPEGDLVWIGNWGDDERTQELHEFLLDPVRKLGLRAKVYGVRYPSHALRSLHESGIEYGGWTPNYKAPEIFARYRVTVHVPRRPYVQALPGIPTIRPFEALACGIPLVSAPWSDAENLFSPGDDFLVARNGAEMRSNLEFLLANPAEARSMAARGLQTILKRHTCAHRVDELFAILDELDRPKTYSASEGARATAL